MNNLERKRLLNKRRKIRIRKKIYGTKERPRLSVYRSLKNIYCQLINDEEGKTICSASSLEKVFKEKRGGNIAAAEEVGKIMGERIKEKGIKSIVFDRNGKAYHGRVKALAEAIRSCDINF